MPIALLVWASSTRVANSSPASKALTMGAQPVACTATIFGSLVSGEMRPMALSSAKAFHMPMSPVPPPVGYMMTSGRSSKPNCSASSSPMVFFPSMR